MTVDINVFWIILCAVLVSTMQAGFCCLESGLVRAKNSINVAIKNLVDFCISCSIFALVGFRLLFGEGSGWLGLALPSMASWSSYDYAFFLFQLTFCGTVTTLVSGAVAERMRFSGYFITAAILAGLVYPVTGHWVWGGLWQEHTPGWLAQLGFHDFAGSTVVHSVGGWMALAAIVIIGPRIGRFEPPSRAIQGHNLPIAVLGVFLLWFGWFGFNGGSLFALADPVPRMLVNTAQGGAAGGLTALLTTWLIHKRPQVQIIMNGVIGGLVAITAGCDGMTPIQATLIGGLGGVFCTVAAAWLSRWRIDDAVGVVPAHLVCGIWGTLAVAFVKTPPADGLNIAFWQQLGIQVVGIGTVGAYAFGVSFGLLRLVDRLLPLRVSADQERLGLNISEHGASTATQDLLAHMNTQALAGDFSQPVWVEPETDAATVAYHYNRVLSKISLVTESLNHSRDRLLTILNSPAFPVVISNPQTGQLHFINERAAELLGFPLVEAVQQNERHFWQRPREREIFLRKIHNSNPTVDFEAELKRLNYGVFWALISGTTLLYDNEQCVLFSFNDISHRKQMEDELKRLAETDALTGVYNRRSFLELAEIEVRRASQENRPLVVLMLDVDRFKWINDTFGHPYGDKILKLATDTCQETLREEGIFGRFGGEEFAILLPNTYMDTAQVVAECLRQAIEGLSLEEGIRKFTLTISVGATELREGDTVNKLIKRADKALYQAKKAGRNQVQFM
ncbi:MAG: ammonium transporter [Cyanobacteria bacterium P01_G01_bin.54]